MKHKVVITGLGLISPFGVGISKNWMFAKKGKTAIAPIKSIDTGTLWTKLGAEIPPIDFRAYFPEIRPDRMDRSTLLALIAAQEAIHQANLTKQDCMDTGIMVGTCFSTIQTKESTYLRLAETEEGISPLIFIKSMDNAASGEIAVHFGLKGINQTIFTACSASTMALGGAYRLIREGYAKRILVGGTESPITRFIIRGWEKLHLISDTQTATQLKGPFSKGRNGLVLGEGAGFLVLESDAEAKRRQASAYASIIGFGTNCDATHLSTPDAHSQSQAIHLALKNARLKPEKVQYINAHGTGTIMNDRVETQAIKLAFEKLAYSVPIGTLKSQIGHTMGASGAIETIFTLLMMRHNTILPTVNFESGDANCDLDYVPNKAREVDSLEYALKTSFGFGGSNAVLILKKEAL